jgi:hypothetical protein
MYNSIDVPVGFSIHLASSNREQVGRVLLAMKMIFIEGKTKLTRNQIKLINNLLGYKQPKRIRAWIKKLQELEWIKFNRKTGYFILKSLQKLPEVKRLKANSKFPCIASCLNNIRAFIGGTIFIYLWIINNNKRKIKSEGGEPYNGGSFHPLGFSSRSKSVFWAEVSLNGINKMFGISQTKVSKLRKLAKEEGYIKVRENFQRLDYDKKIKTARLRQLGINAVFRNGKHWEQKPSLVYPLDFMKRCKNAKHNNGDYKRGLNNS